MQLTTHVSFQGQCEAAFKFYETCLGAKVNFLMTWGESPMADQAPRGWEKKVLHANLVVGGVSLSGDDAIPGNEGAPQGFALTINTTDAAEAERLFHALAENGKVTMPLAETFWAVRFGVLTDQFGIPWMINCGKPM
jgi:PhnB protein